MVNIKLKIEELKKELTEEMSKERPNNDKINKIKQKIMMLGLGLTSRDFKTPF
jgi:hypothetical protein